LSAASCSLTFMFASNIDIESILTITTFSEYLSSY
jgi:hypothetical protein